MNHAVARLGAALADRYVIEREAGAGGMATVYLAHDVRHDRKVALKVLRPELAAILGGERFLKEIRLTANLQHPHILPLHDSGEADGTVFYVMPYVEGESLRDRLMREKQLPVDDAVRIASEVADALEHAHAHGIIHRDIKPENILLYGGHALVADFGIALAASKSDGATRMTETGMSLGTPAYMAPEQAMGEREISPKADIYALGATLYEMLSGEPPFVGPTAQAIIARVMTEDPRALTLHRHTIPPHVEAAVRCALEKLPADRFATAAEFRAALANPAFAPAGAGRPAVPSVGPSGRRSVAAALPWVLVLAAAAAAAAGWLRPGPERAPLRFALALPPGQEPLPIFPVTPSPDGAHLLYVGPVPGARTGVQLWLKARHEHHGRPVPGTVGAWNATFSPDGQWIAFVQDGRVRKLNVTGGAPVTLADSAGPTAPGIAWLDDGTIVYIQRGALTLRRVPQGGGPSSVVWTDSFGVWSPEAVPGGRLLFARCVARGCADLGIWGIGPGEDTPREVLNGAVWGQHIATGHLLFVRPDGRVFTVRFDAGAMRTAGTPVALLDSVGLVGAGVLLRVSRTGTMVMRTGSTAASDDFEMVWMDRDGRATPVDMGGPVRIDDGNANAGWSLSPDGRRLAIGLLTGSGLDIWVKELPAGPLSRVTFDSAADIRPRWLPSGREITYVAIRGTGLDLRRVRADGTGGDEVLARHADGIFDGTVTADGQWIVARVRGGLGRQARDIIGFRRGDTAAVPLVATPFDESAVALSPDGRWLAYESDETGRREVYIRPFPATDRGKWQASTSGGYAPLWARNGRELFFVDAERRMTAMGFTPGTPPLLGARRTLFPLAAEAYLSDDDYYTPWDVNADGTRFIMARRRTAAGPSAAPLVVVEHWFTELRQRMEGSL
jgi:eukaryotic-like serine/threonine-protein kinase